MKLIKYITTSRKLINVALPCLFAVCCISLLSSCDKKGPAGQPDVSISALIPAHAAADSSIIIKGQGFSTTKEENLVKINGVVVAVNSAKDTSLIITIPRGIGTGAVTVSVKDKSATGPGFTYDLTAQVSTFAGSGLVGSADGTGTAATFNTPYGTYADANGNIYVTDHAHSRIRKISSTAAVTTFAGFGEAGYANGPVADAKFLHPYGICMDASGNMYVADGPNNTIRKISTNGTVGTIAGSTFSGSADGKGTAARFYDPVAICIDNQGNLYVSEYSNNRIRKIAPDSTVTTLAGSTAGFADGNGTEARFHHPYGICIDAQENLYVSDYENNRVRKVTPTGVVSTLAGSANPGTADGAGTAARFHGPTGICVDNQGNVFVSDYNNNRVRKITPASTVFTIAGKIGGDNDGNATLAKFQGPNGICINPQGNLFVADFNNHKIKKIIFY